MELSEKLTAPAQHLFNTAGAVGRQALQEASLHFGNEGARYNAKTALISNHQNRLWQVIMDCRHPWKRQAIDRLPAPQKPLALRQAATERVLLPQLEVLDQQFDDARNNLEAPSILLLTARTNGLMRRLGNISLPPQQR